ncbi:MAG: DUF5106 domain-containing protein [Flavobacteriales bacterium]|nr:DUF5106 domain-containing protein [Flavobacteriales bacterium]
MIQGLTVAVGILLSVQACAQNQAAESPYTIKIEAPETAGQEVYLANYYGNKLYYNDTTVADSKGVATFKGKPFEECGKYAVVFPGPKVFDILVAEEDIYIKTKASDPVSNLDIVQSRENQIFYEYLDFISDKKSERAPIDECLRDSLKSDEDKEPCKEELKKLNDMVVGKQQQVVTEHADMLVGKIINMALDVEVPKEIKAQAEEDRSIQYYWYRDHYWDHVDFSDPRLVRDQMFHRLLEKYYTQVLPQIPDSLANEAIKLVEKTNNNDMFKYIVHYVTYQSETSKIMCMDKIFVKMVDRYYRTGKADWLDDEQLEKVLESANKKQNVLCGEPVTNVILPDTTLTNWVSLYDVDAKYTVVAIWESSCGHCKKEMPKLKEFYSKWKDKGVEVYAIGNDFETEPWLEFLEEYEIQDWINVSDNPQINKQDSAAVLIRSGITTLPSLNFRTTFDVFSTPKVFLLDQDKVLIAKQLSVEQLEELITRMEEDDNSMEDQGSLESNPAEGTEVQQASTDTKGKEKNKNKDKRKNKGS